MIIHAKECIVKKFSAVLVFVMVLASVTYAADHNPADTLLIQGKILPVFDVDATAGSVIELNEEGIVLGAAQQVGTVLVKTNNRYWKISVASANHGSLVATEDTDTYSIPYSFVLAGNGTAGANWAAAAVILNTGIGTWTTSTLAFTKRTTPSTGDGLLAKIYYHGAATNGANWVSQTTAGADLIYKDTVTITAAVY